MKFDLISLQKYLLQQFRIPPGWVWLDTRFRQDLDLSDSEMRQLTNYVSQQTGLDISAGMTANLTDVFDLLVHVLLRTDEAVTPVYFESMLFEGVSSGPDFQLFGVALLQHLHVN